MIRRMTYFKTDEKKPRAYRPTEITFSLYDHSSAPTLRRSLPACATPLQDLVFETENCLVLPFSPVLFSPLSHNSLPAPGAAHPNHTRLSYSALGCAHRLRDSDAESLHHSTMNLSSL